MSIGNEIVTLQFGHYSNYIGAHWLNIQEAGFSFNPDFKPEINNDILFREGISSTGEPTYTPRLLMVDFKKSLGHLETPENLDKISENVRWEEDKIDNLIDHPQHKPNEYLKDAEELRNNKIPILKSSYDLNNSVNTWSDYLVQPLHSKSFNILNNYQIGCNSQEFCSYELGVQVWRSDYFQDDYIDKIRWYVEECDNIQGFQTLVDAHNGFSGLTSKCLEYLKDEYGKKCILTIPSYCYDFKKDGIDTKKQDLHYILNVMAGMSQYLEFSDLITPVSLYSSVYSSSDSRMFKNLAYSSDSIYHSSAIIGMALDSVTLPYRTRDSYFRMNDMIKSLTLHGRCVAAIGMNFPFPMTNYDKLITVLEKWENKWFESITPEVDIDIDNMNLQLINVRGIKDEEMYEELNKSDESNPAYSCKSVDEMFTTFFQFSLDNVKTNVKSYKRTVRIPPTYPRIFNENYNLMFDPNNPWGRLAELRLLSSLHSTPDIQNLLKSMLSQSRSKIIERLSTNVGIIPTDFNEMQETIERVISCYNDSSWIL